MTSISPRAAILLAALLLCVICLAVLSRLPEPKVIESARSLEDLNRLTGSWSAQKLARTAFALGFDYLFMAAYVTFIGLGCATAADRAQGFRRMLGMVLAYAQIATGLLDATENATLIRLLTSGYDPAVMSVARFATGFKFIIPAAGLLYMASGWIVNRLARQRILQRQEPWGG